MTAAPEVPASFASAKSALKLRLHGEIPLAILQIELETTGAESAYPVVDDFGIVRCGVAVETPDAFIDVNNDMIANWGVSSRELFQAAKENHRGRDVTDIRRIGEKTYVFGDESFSAAVALYPSMVRQFPVDGDPVLIPVARQGVFLTGSHDLEGLRTAAALGDKLLVSGATPVSVTPLTISDIFWSDQDWSWPTEVAASPEVGLLQRRFRTILQARQKRAIDIGWDGIPVAEAQLVTRPDGSPWTIATWMSGTHTWLPVVDDYLLVRDVGSVEPIPMEKFLHSWAHRLEVTGNPRLYRVFDDLAP